MWISFRGSFPATCLLPPSRRRISCLFSLTIWVTRWFLGWVSCLSRLPCGRSRRGRGSRFLGMRIMACAALLSLGWSRIRSRWLPRTLLFSIAILIKSKGTFDLTGRDNEPNHLQSIINPNINNQTIPKTIKIIDQPYIIFFPWWVIKKDIGKVMILSH
jgi:hypothetical protein